MAFQEDGPNVKTNPLANHGGPVVNAIEACRARWPKQLEDVITSRRFIFEALQEVGMVPLNGHKGDSYLMHPGLPHDMETCPTVEELLQQMMDHGQLEVSNESRDERHVCMQPADKESPKKPKPLVIHFTRGVTPQKHQGHLMLSGSKPVPFPYKNNKAVLWRYAPPRPSARKEDTIGIDSLSAKVTNITGLSGVTRSGRIFVALDLSARPANAKGKAKVVEEPTSEVLHQVASE